MTKIIVSACLLGCDCRYKGDNCKNERIIDLSKEHTIIPVCPEQMGGLSTPRDPSEIVGNQFISNKGKDVTKEYTKGANMALNIAKLNNAKIAILKYKSPSCSKGMIYDGTFSGNLIEGNGITADLFMKNGIAVYTEDEIEQIEEVLKNQED